MRSDEKLNSRFGNLNLPNLSGKDFDMLALKASNFPKINVPNLDDLEFETYDQDIAENTEKMLKEIQIQRDDMQQQRNEERKEREREKQEFKEREQLRIEEAGKLKTISIWSMIFGGVGGISGLIAVVYTFMSN